MMPTAFSSQSVMTLASAGTGAMSSSAGTIHPRLPNMAILPAPRDAAAVLTRVNTTHLAALL